MGAITYTSLTASVCAVGSTGGALTYVASGTCTIEATQAADVIDGDGTAASETNITVSVPTSHSITFNGNGSTGGLMAPETDFTPTPLSANAFSRTGYVFAGWNSAADGSGTAYADGASDPFTANQTLFAQWTINASYSVIFNGNGSTGGLMAPETDFTPTPLSANAFSRTGYVFAGWNSAADGSGTAYADGASDPFTANQTLFAQWTINASYSVIFNGNGSTGGLMAPETDFTPTPLSANAFSRTGYVFAGWNSAADGSGTAYADGASDPFTANQTLFAQWTINASYSVIFNGNGSTGGLMAPETDFTPTPLSANAFSRTGYVFAGWNSAADGSGTAYADGASDPFTANQTLFAQWTINASYSVIFNGNGSTGGLMAPETDFTPTPLSANAFSRTGYVFAGWNSAADGSGTAYADGASDPFTANQTLFAQWTINASYSVIFNGNGSTGGLMAPETDFTPTPLSANAFSRTGYVFAGWNSAADGSGTAYADGASDPFTANQTLFAQWTINASYSVTFNGNGSTGGLMAPETDFTPTPLSANAFSRTGYVFAGWNSAADGSGTAYADGASDPFTANQTLFAQWTINASYSVIFNGNGSTGGLMAPETDFTPTPLSANAFSRTGYVFAGWNSAADGSGTAYADGASDPFTANQTLFAQWTINASYSVIFNGNGSTGGLMAPETDFTPTPLSANAFSRTGYVFAGWNSAADGSGTAYADGASDPFTANQTLFAQWTINASYSVIFNGNGSTGGLMAPETDFTPTPLSANAFSRTGYVFAGWNSAADGSGTAYADGASDPFTANQTLFAQWTINATNPAPPTVVPTAPTSPPGAAAKGYYLVGSDGGIFTFGGAQFYGSTGSLNLQRPVVGITATAGEGGYWLVASDGGIFSFGDAGFYGSIPGLGLAPAGTVGSKHLNAPIVGMVPSFDGGGYFIVASDGGVFAFGDAAFEGSCPGIGGCGGAAVAVAPDASGRGYWLITASGNIYTLATRRTSGPRDPRVLPSPPWSVPPTDWVTGSFWPTGACTPMATLLTGGALWAQWRPLTQPRPSSPPRTAVGTGWPRRMGRSSRTATLPMTEVCRART